MSFIRSFFIATCSSMALGLSPFYSVALGQVPGSTPAASLVVTPLALDEKALSQLAIQDHGRKKPFTTFAQESLLRLAELPLGSSLRSIQTSPLRPPSPPAR